MNRNPQSGSVTSLPRAFAKALLPHGIPRSGGHYLAAFSGGADSTALLLLLHGLCRAQKHPPRLTALHVNHGIRGTEADRDAAFCRTFCSEHGIPFVLCEADVPARARQLSLSLEECAREVRYECIRTYLYEHPDITHVLTAHHADDQNETVLFRLLRGTSLHGLSGIPASRSIVIPTEDGGRTVPLIRPLLRFTHAQLCAYLGEAQQSYVTDSTNTQNDASRNLLRNVLLPAAAQINPSFTDSLRHLSDDAAEDTAYFRQAVEAFFAENGMTPATPIPKDLLKAQHPAVLRRILAAVYGEHMQTCTDAKPFSHAYLDAMRSALHNSSRTVLPRIGIFSCETEFCRMLPLSDRTHALPDFSLPLIPGEICSLPDGNACFAADGTEHSVKTLQYLKNIYKFVISTHINSDKLLGSMFVRARSTDNKQDRYLCGGSHKTVRDVLSSHKVPREKRPYLPLFCDGEGIVWVPHCGIRDSVNLRLHDGSVFDLYYFYNDEVT